MREIKFRIVLLNTLYKGHKKIIGYERNIDGVWFFSNLGSNNWATAQYYDFFGKEGKVLKDQYIGLKDKNGKEIYEGDIVRINNKYNDKIEWSDGYLGWMPWVSNQEGWDMANSFTCEILGNIYENIELLNNYKHS